MDPRLRTSARWTGFFSTGTILVLTSILNCCVCCSSFQDNAPEAAVGERLSLLCSLGSRCDSSYRWTQVTSNETLEERGANLVLSENLTSVDWVEGKLYRCECTDDDNDDCLLFRIVVVPVAQINLSGNVTKVGGSSVMRVGGSVTITCTGAGEGSPPPTNFTLTHEGNQLTSLDGTYTIPSVEKKHSGKYGCVPKTVLREYPNDPLQGDEVGVQLTVYEPPSIVCTDNDTVAYRRGEKQSAVLECAFDKGEDWLNVSVKWTMANGEEIKVPHTVATARKSNNVSYLLLHDVSNEEEYIFSCYLYSQFRLVDRKFLAVNLTVDVDCDDLPTELPTITKTPAGDEKKVKILAVGFFIQTVVAIVVAIVSFIFRNYIIRQLCAFKDKCFVCIRHFIT